jgi:hypothetical protein
MAAHQKNNLHPSIEAPAQFPTQSPAQSPIQSPTQADHAELRPPIHSGTKLPAAVSSALAMDDDGWASDDETGEEVVKQVDEQGGVIHKAVIMQAVVRRKSCSGC